MKPHEIKAYIEACKLRCLTFFKRNERYMKEKNASTVAMSKCFTEPYEKRGVGELNLHEDICGLFAS